MARLKASVLEMADDLNQFFAEDVGTIRILRTWEIERGGREPWNIRLSAFRQPGSPRPSRRRNSIARSTNRKRRSRSVAISWPSNRSISLHCVYLGSPLQISSPDAASDRYRETEEIFRQLQDPYERLYYTGILHERRAKAQLNAGQLPHSLVALFDQALHSFAEAERIRPSGNDDAILRWNRCVRLLQNQAYEWGELEQELVPFDSQETPPR